MAHIPITAYSVCNALGLDREAVWRAFAGAESGLALAQIPLDFETWTGAVSAELPALTGVCAPWDTPATRIASWLLSNMEDAWRNLMARWSADRVAVLVGTSTAGVDRTEEAFQYRVAHGHIPADYDLWKHHTYGTMLDVIRTITGAQGPAWVVSTACTSSAKPLASAARMMEAGTIDAAIVGGIDTLCAMTLQGFHALTALSSEPTRPFSAGRNGINIGEGGALMLLEREGAARGYLEGVGESSDAYHAVAPDPQGHGARLAIRRALQHAQLTGSDIDFVNAHGTGTQLNDAMEATAIAAEIGTHTPVISTKGYTGHTLGAAGATEAVLCLMALEAGLLPPSLHADPLDETLPITVVQEAAKGAYRTALSNSFAFGGNNISVVLRAAGGAHD